jgi:hypothetical protein
MFLNAIGCSRKDLKLCSQFKTALTCFFGHKGTGQYEFIAQGQTLNQQCYMEELTRLQESPQRIRPNLWPDSSVLHHDSAHI